MAVGERVGLGGVGDAVVGVGSRRVGFGGGWWVMDRFSEGAWTGNILRLICEWEW